MRRIYLQQIRECKLSKELLADIYDFVMSHRLCGTECSESTFDELSRILKGIKPGFADSLISLIDRKHMKDSDVYNRAGLMKQTFNKIKNKKVMPKKETAMSLCIGARLSFEEAEELLKTAGYSFSESIAEDMVFRYYLEHKMYNIIEVYNAMYRLGIKDEK